MLNPRLDRLTDYPFQRLRDLLDPLAPPKGLDPIAMTIGEPRHPFPGFVHELLAAHGAELGRYPNVRGTEPLLAAIAGWLGRRYRLPDGMIDAGRMIAPLNGSKEGLYMAAQVVVPPPVNGHAPLVAMPNPFYQVYYGAAVMAGAEPLFLPARAETGFLPDLDRLDETTLSRLAALYICTPGNPQGTVADAAYLGRLIDLARAHDFALIVDECYAEIYDREPPTGILEVCATRGGDLTNVLAFHSLSKRSSLPGLRSGFAVGDPKIVSAFIRLRDYGGAPSSLPTYAAAAALWNDEAHVVENRARYVAKIDLAESILGNRFGFYRPPGGFFLWLDVGDGEVAARRLWQEAALRVLPGAYLSRDGADGNPGQAYIRVALVDAPPLLRDGLGRIADIL
ncbi:aminotransferase class I/II-fold pyridoxal phosphate-dependent enzyme [Oceanibacterium hippocampi]|uniref:LL-diaminopimelate aminotransferase n=1 Tax=Oceanibacterium hippocampi TaxID=745714 RepID=A0A1Y5RF13_9PROT|nr:aminotransferase class I/II-fold pyridoxal phosphate-dependent enzyme [Oceanibacterium hippocampi]SLN16063.1 LL-diaminopimelate aminotransferase [Oceanibacterium hippocampi]